MMTDNNQNDNKLPKKPEEDLGLFDIIIQGALGIPRLMRSLSFAIWVIIILAVLTLAGTILPQQHLSRDPVEFGLTYKALFDVDPSDGVNSFREFFYYNIVKRLQLYNIFKSQLYFTLLVLLTISSILCAWDRMLLSRKLLRKTDPSIKSESVKRLKHSFSARITGDPDKTVGNLRSKLKKSGFELFEKEYDDGRICFLARKNAMRNWWVVVFHFALVFILAGGLLGDEKMFGYTGTIALAEGESQPVGSKQHSDWLEKSKNNSAGPFVPDYPEEIKLVDYVTIYREKDFGSINPETGFPEKFMSMPSDYISDLQITRPDSSGNRQVVAEKRIQVNYPLRWGGIGYYQSSVNFLTTFLITDQTGQERRVQAYLYNDIPLGDTGWVAQVKNGDIVGGIWEDKDGNQSPLPYAVKLVDYGAPMRGMAPNPIILGYVSEDQPLDFSGIEVKLEDVQEFSILTYSHDPGLPLTYLGFILMSLGVTLSLYMPFRTGRLVVTRRDNSVEYTAGSSWEGFTAIFNDAETLITRH